MKTFSLLLAGSGLLLHYLALAQNYNAGTGSGTGGSNNAFVGYFAGHSNTSAGNNSFLGTNAGFQNTTGNNNSFLGSHAGYSNTIGVNNSFLGYYAGFSNTSGGNNNFVGTQAGYSNTTGGNNNFVGGLAGYSNTTGSSNSFVGSHAGQFNTTGYFNSFVGSNAGNANTIGKYNSFVGSAAGNANTTGSSNSFVGGYAGASNTSGYQNSFVGTSAGQFNTTGYDNNFLGTFAGTNTTIGSGNVFLGRSAGEKNTNGYFNISLGNFSGPSLTNLQNAGAIGYRASVSASNSLVLGSINGVNGATASAKVGIGTTAPGYLLHVNGTAAKPGGGSWTVASDQRLKQDISEFTDGLAQLEKIRPVWFRYNGKAGLPTEKKYVGIIAQEMQQIVPYTIGEFTYQDSTGRQEQYLDYDANALTYMLVNAVKELKQENEALKNKLSEVDILRQELTQLKALLAPGNTATTAQLFQNAPNPTDGSTVIPYFLPLETTSAQLKIYSLSGQEMQSVELSQKGHGQVKLSVGQLAAGEYVYRLLVNGKSIASKKLLLEK